MISLEKTGNAIKFTFDDNGHYLQDGTIEVPVNSLTLVTDDSEMFTFKKSATNDIFVSGLYSEIGMSKSELETFYKDNMVGSTGGGSGSGITSGEVQTMIDESISGKVDTSTFNTHTANTEIHVTATEKNTWNNKSDFSGNYNDLSNKPTIPTVPTSNTAFTNDAGYATSGYVDSVASGLSDDISTALSGKQDTLVSGTNIKTINNESILGSGNITIQGGGGTVSSAITSGDTNAVAGGAVYDKFDEVEEVTARALNSLYDSLSGKVETSAFTAYSATVETALSGKQATLVSGTNIKTINNTSILGSGNIDIQGGGATYSGGSGINIDSANTISAVYDGWHGERVHYLYAITTPFYLYKADDCGWRNDFDVFFEINGAQSQVKFDVLTHTYVLVEGDSSWEDYVTVEWDASGCFKATPNTQISVSDASCARFSKLYYSGTTENAIDGALDRIESIKNSAIGNIEFGTRDIYNDLYIYPSALNGQYINMSTVGLEGGLKVKGSNISTQMQSTPYKWISGATIGDYETSTFNAPSSAVTFNISRNPSEYLYAIDVNGSAYVIIDSNGDNQSPSYYSVVIVSGSVTVSALSTDKYITKIIDNQSELNQYVSDVQYWGYEADTIPNVVLNIKDDLSGKVETSAVTSSMTSSSTDAEIPSAKCVYDTLGGLKLVKLTQSAYDALSPNYDNNTLYVIVN